MTESGIRRLKGIIRAFGETQADLAREIGVSLSRLNAKLNGTGGAEFSLGEIAAIKRHYRLTSEEVDNIFFG